MSLGTSGTQTKRDKISLIISFTLVQLLYICIMNKQRTIIFYKDYFEEFFEKQREKVKAKIIGTLELIEELERIPET